MILVKRAAARVAAGVLAAAALAIAGPATAQAATDAGGAAPVTGTLTITPSTTVVGGQVVVVATATNNTSSTVAASLGIENPQYAAEQITAVSGHACTPRNLRRLIYCGNNLLAPGASMTITVKLTAIAGGTDNFTVYARVTYTTDDTFAYGTLTVS
ncbi:hypothetical protein KGA66_13820 [Actinocrinis puniceicyclus]|uniref:DUF11 domain-containing protein n=1 Tax=Actinocrinis puniceicyclus TaxID=977794 RepID=A0A8J8BDG8_9ACTN|nr:hypothetical protein [Actinocrinis puniceicyclus]MBS2964131.1 hypothetical protein [Actinocrinis puniceicyclus]